MLRRALVVLIGGASGACGFAALGLALYSQGPSQAAALLFGCFGFASGALCALLPSLRRRLPSHRHAELPGPALVGMVRATLASAAAERPARSSTAANRRPAGAAAAAAEPIAAPAAIAAVDARRFASSSFGA